MSNLVTIPYYQGALSVDDLSNLLAVKMFLPFTNDLLDKSESHQTVTNVGNTILSDKGANFNGFQRLDTTFKFSIGKTYTVEFIYNGDTTTVGTFIGGGATSGLVIGKENGNLAITGAGGNLVSIESISAYSNKETSYQLIIKIVSSTSLTVDMYVNGSLIIANKSIELSTGLVETTTISIGALNTGGAWYRYLNGVLGGVRIVEKALTSAQFTLLRPMTIPYPTFKVGAKLYLYKDGINLLGNISSTYWNIVDRELYCSLGAVVTTATITFLNKITMKKGQRLYVKTKIRNKGFSNYFQIVINAGSDINSQYLGTSLPSADITIDYSVYSMIEIPNDGIYAITFKAVNGNASWLWNQWVTEIWVE